MRYERIIQSNIVSIQLLMKRYFTTLYEKIFNGEEDDKMHISDGVQSRITGHLCTEMATRKFSYKKLYPVYDMQVNGVLSNLSHVNNHDFFLSSRKWFGNTRRC